MGYRTPPAKRRKIVAMYRRGEPISVIATATGSSAIHSVLRQEGLESDRARRLRNPEVRRQREEAAIRALQDAAEHLETNILRIAAYRQWRTASEDHHLAESTITKLFGSWHAALAAAGLQAAQPGTKDPICDENDLIGWLQRAAEPDGIVGRASYDQWRLEHCPEAPPSHQVHTHFGWTAICAKAGVRRKHRSKKFSDSEMIESLRASGNGYAVTMTQYEQWRNAQPGSRPAHSGTIIAHFGDWTTAHNKADLKQLAGVTDDQLLGFVRAATKELGRHPTSLQYADWARQHPDRRGLRALQRRYSFATRALKPAEPAD